MNTHADKKTENKSQAVANALQNQQSGGSSTLQFEDNRPKAVAQRKLQDSINNSPQVKQLISYQKMADNHSSPSNSPNQNNDTGLPDPLKSGLENLSGYSMDDVRVHYNSNKPSNLNAHAYTQGTAIYIASGQEKHLPHEAWHVVQQKQFRVKPTLKMGSKVNVNNDSGLEREADIMGAKLASNTNQAGPDHVAKLNYTSKTSEVIQGVFTQTSQGSWIDKDTNIVYQQISILSEKKIALMAHNQESFVIERDDDNVWNRVDKEGEVTLIPKRDKAYRVHTKFTGFSAVDSLKKDGKLLKDDLPYSGHGIIRDQEFRDFFSDIPSLPKKQKPSPAYLELLQDRTRAYNTLAQPKPPKKDFHKRPFESGENYSFSVDASGGLPFHQADDLIKSSYQIKDKKREKLSVQDLYEAEYLTNFNRIVPQSTLYAPFTQTQQSEHWLTTLGPTLDVNSPPTISDSSAGTDYKGVHTVFKIFLELISEASNNPDFIEKTAKDTELFLDKGLIDIAVNAHNQAYLSSANKKRSKSANGEGMKSRKRKNLTNPEKSSIVKAHKNISLFLAGEDAQFATKGMGENVQKVAYLFYIKLIRRAISNVIMLSHSGKHDLETKNIMDDLLDQFVRLADLQGKLYTGSEEEMSVSEHEDSDQGYIPAEVQLLAHQNGVLARYGGSNGNNCLIYAVAGALGVILSDQKAANIRNWLNHNSVQRDHFNPGGQLPMLPVLIQEIINQLLQQGHQINGNVTVVTTGGNFNAQGAVANNGDDGNVLVILHGAHYYFTQKQNGVKDDTLM